LAWSVLMVAPKWNGVVLFSLAVAPGNILDKVRDGLIARVAGGMGSWDQDGEVQRLFIREIVREVGNRLAGPNPTAIERILAERAAVCWLWAYAEDLTVLNRGPASLEQAKWDLQRQNAAHRRFLSAVNALATVQKLAVPILIKKAGQVYVNVSGKQTVNNAGKTSWGLPSG
jgi:hypothetical protein